MIARDTRTSSPMLENAATAGLVAVGCDVYDSEIAPTPALQYAVRNFDFDAGVMITGSHIPPERNGLKFFISDGTEVYGKIEEEIEDMYFKNKIEHANWRDIGRIHAFDCVGPYKEMLLKTGIEGDLKVVVDPGHGAQCNVMPLVLRELGYEVITINSQPDGYFPGRNPEPTEKTMDNLIKVMKSLNADFGVALDGDGDRSIFVGDGGKFLMGDITAAVIADAMEAKKVVTPISSSSLIDWVVKKNNGQVIKTKVGAADVVAETQKQGADFAFEENGGCIFPQINLCRDGGLATVYLLNILTKKGKTLSEIISELPEYHQIKSKVECSDELKPKLTEKVKEFYADQEIVDIDGLKVLFDDGWMLFRSSGTEPIFRIFVEAETKERAEKLMEEGLKTVKELLKG